MLVPRVYEKSSGGRSILIVVAMPILPHLFEVVCEQWASALVGTHVTVVQVLALRSCFWGPVINNSESNVNNLWESDSPMKGIYQGNEFDEL